MSFSNLRSQLSQSLRRLQEYILALGQLMLMVLRKIFLVYAFYQFSYYLFIGLLGAITIAGAEGKIGSQGFNNGPLLTLPLVVIAGELLLYHVKALLALTVSSAILATATVVSTILGPFSAKWRPTNVLERLNTWLRIENLLFGSRPLFTYWDLYDNYPFLAHYLRRFEEKVLGLYHMFHGTTPPNLGAREQRADDNTFRAQPEPVSPAQAAQNRALLKAALALFLKVSIQAVSPAPSAHKVQEFFTILQNYHGSNSTELTEKDNRKLLLIVSIDKFPFTLTQNPQFAEFQKEIFASLKKQKSFFAAALDSETLREVEALSQGSWEALFTQIDSVTQDNAPAQMEGTLSLRAARERVAEFLTNEQPAAPTVDEPDVAASQPDTTRPRTSFFRWGKSKAPMTGEASTQNDADRKARYSA